jgi:hypothetical protein
MTNNHYQLLSLLEVQKNSKNRLRIIGQYILKSTLFSLELAANLYVKTRELSNIARQI